MKTRILLVALTAAVALGLAAAADPAPAPRAADDVQDIVFFGETRPVLVRLHLRVNGEPFQAAWDDFIRQVFEYLDRDKDGVLSRAEAERTPPAAVLFGNNFFGGPAPPTPEQIDADRDGKITREELGRYYRANGGAPFQLRVGGQMGIQPPVAIAGQVPPPSADGLNTALFRLLDTDEDGKLSKEELAAAPTVLLRLDADDDEIIVPQEVMPGSNPLEAAQQAVERVEMARRVSNPIFRAINPGESPTDLVRQLLARYGRGGETPARKLTRKASGLDDETFNHLDKDNDGALDSEELARFARRPPDIELAVNLGRVDAKEAPIDLVQPQGRPMPLTANLHKSKEGSVFFDLGTTRLDFRAAGLGRGPLPLPNIREAYKMQFAAADKDNNGYLDMNEARQGRFFATLFKLMDQDGDGMLYQKEMLAYLDQMQALQAKALACCVSMSVSDQGRGLFDLFDSNRDGRLGMRELRNAVNLVASLDRDGDGQVGKDEIPRSYQVTLAPGALNANPFGGPVVVAVRGGPPAPVAARPSRGPVWFVKMDRNRDGDISRREFLGTDEQFAQIDTDGDGLISVEEAERADAAFRRLKGPGP
ncbi:MAG TPA: EF-hand domain-containing protein [Gemmataceae bacterium]|nr:EF-hand domain-containing protein [Gemmataceae bacterium]